MNKKMITIMTALVLTVLMIVEGDIVAKDNSEFYIEGAPVIGEYIPDLQEEFFSRQKSDLANKYYQLKVSNKKGQANNRLSIFRIGPERLEIYQFPQEKNFWCGYAVIQSLLSYEKVYKSQATIASEVYSKSKACPWYLSHGNDDSQFPVPNYLNRYIKFGYVAYPHGAAGANPMSADTLKRKIIFTIDNKHGVLACGRSVAGEIRLPGYPSYYVGHWLAIDGYDDDGNTIYIIDPAKSDVIPWSKDIKAYYTVSAWQLSKFCATRGIVY